MCQELQILLLLLFEFLTSQLRLGNIHLSWDVGINRIRLGGLTCSLKSFLKLNMCQELKILLLLLLLLLPWKMLDDSLFNFFDLGGRGSGRGTFPLDLTSGSGFATASNTEGVSVFRMWHLQARGSSQTFLP